MSKALAIAGAGAGAATITVGSYYLTSGGGKSASEETNKAKEIDLLENVIAHTSTNTPSPFNLADFKKNSVKDKECVKDIFGNENISLDESATSSSDPDSNFLGNTPEESAKDTTKGCLIINYKKEKQTDGKGSGAFTGTWAFVNKDKGFINFNSAVTEADKKLKLTGGFYLVEKSTEGSQNAWKVKWKDEGNSDGKQIESKDVAGHFPQLNAKFKPSQVPENKNYWGFFDGEEKLDNPVTYKGTWQYATGDGGNKIGIGEWSKDLTWGNNLYSTTKGKFDLENKLASFKGTWTQVQPSSPAPAA